MKSSVNSLIQIIKELNYILDKKQKKYAVVVFFATLLNSLCELIGVAIILPFIEMIQNPQIVMNRPKCIKIMTLLGISSDKQLLLLIGGAITLIYIVKCMYALFFTWLQSDFTTKFSYDMATKTLKSYLSQPYTFFLRTNSSVIVNGCGSDVPLVANIIAFIMNIISSLITIIILTSYLIYTDLFITVSMLTIVGILMVAMVVFIKPVMKKIGKIDADLNNKKNEYVLQITGGIKEIFVSRNQEFFYNKYDNAYNESRKASRQHQFLDGLPARIIETVCVIAIIVVLCIKIILGSVNDSFLPKLAIFAVSLFRMFPLCSTIVNRLNSIVFLRPRLANLYTIHRNARSYNEKYISNINSQLNDISTEIHFNNKISLSDVSWKYNDDSDYILNNLSLDIHYGESIGFIGESGSGKTTLIDTIMGLFSPQKGTITVDGIDISSIPDKWATMVSYVPQSTYLIDDSIRENVSFGVRTEKETDEKIWECLKKAAIADFIMTLPDGLDTQVGERGVRLSGGQRQRIAIARALYKNPEILVLDEATSALDNDTEAAIMESIDNLKGSITMLIIAHRLSTVSNCDRIIKIKDGKGLEVNKKEFVL